MTVTLHWVLLALAGVQGSGLYEAKRPVTYVFWVFAVSSLALAIATSYRNPGYCPIIEKETSIQQAQYRRNPAANVVPKLTNEDTPEAHQFSESPLQGSQDCSAQLELSLEISSSCKESEFQAISDPAPTPIPPRQDEISILLPSLQPTAHVETSIQATDNTREGEIRLRYCPLCNIEQRIRSKHCVICRRCVARYDHHCPWLSTCIGEKNHLCFLFFLYSLCTELLIGIALVGLDVDAQESGPRRWLGAGLIGAAALLLLLLFSLCLYQTCLLFANLTTWEYQSWKQITYLQTRKRGISPFSKGCIGNIAAFCKSTRNSELTDWAIPISSANVSN